ncbi:permease for cytosine/purines, uracil, thiamine, allantoin-domain-containing protein [Pholiota molesta]|nr:permease for cytosine/purines, uracil, thiamine, allantoin-domain-containing protein [Pholiota molesta]
MATQFIRHCKQKIIIQSAANDANEDLLPTPPEQRTWTWWTYSSLWAGQSFDATWWNVGSSLIGVGLTVAQTVVPVLIGCLLLGVAAVLNASFGAHYHVGFPAMIRPTFGVTGSKWFVGLRGLVGIVWYAVQVYYCGQLMSIMFLCVFGSSYRDWDPAVPASAGTDAKTILVYFLAWAIAFPLTLIHPSKLRDIFTSRAIFGGAAFFAMFVWCTTLGQRDPKGFQGFNILQAKPISGPELGWAIMSGINSILGTTVTMITNQSDVSRYARTPKQAGWPQGFAIFTTKTMMAFLSIVATASLQSRYGGIPLWNIWDQLHLLLDENWDAKTRVGCFVIALGVAYSIMVTNLYANGIAFGADISAIFPRYFNIVRGQMCIAFISLPVLPWQILTNAQAFLMFLGSYTFLMGALLGCQWGDFIFRKGNYHVPSMYDYGNDCIYMYSKGYNWRGFAAWFVSFCIIFPGLIAAYVPNKMNIASMHIYSMGWLIGVPLSMLCYIVFNKLFPIPIVPEKHADAPEPKKWLGMSSIHGFFPGDTIDGMDIASNDGSSATEGEKSKDVATMYTTPV